MCRVASGCDHQASTSVAYTCKYNHSVMQLIWLCPGMFHKLLNKTAYPIYIGLPGFKTVHTNLQGKVVCVHHSYDAGGGTLAGV